MKLSNEQIIYIIGLVLLASLITWIYILQGQKAELELKNAAYHLKIEQIQAQKDRLNKKDADLGKLILKRNKVIDSLINELNKLPTDNEVKDATNITLLKPNSSWDTIKAPIDAVIADTTWR
jgi:hypothetical protein